MKRMMTMIAAGASVLVLAALPAAAHPHEVANRHHTQVLANAQNHPSFVDQGALFLSCAGVAEPTGSGPAGYGLETAHHGPDAGTLGQADGCFATQGAPQDNNPAID